VIEHILEWLELAAGAIEFFAVMVIVVGFIRAVIYYHTTRKAVGREAAFPVFRIQMGMCLLLGLEILVIADVIETITTESTFERIVVLAFLVVTRTIVSWSTSLQVEGKWPWQPEAGEETGNE
jgi:uncharacterized membrane protein